MSAMLNDEAHGGGSRERAAGRLDRRAFLGVAAGAAALGCRVPAASAAQADARPGEDGRARSSASPGGAVMVGSGNALAGMREHYASLASGAAPLDAAIEVVKVAEADPDDMSVGLGGLPNEDGVVTLDAAVMDGATHNAGSVACIENILHPSEVARLVMERTDHVMIVGPGAYEFARAHGHPHTELLLEPARKAWMRWKETMSDRDDRLPPPSKDLEQALRGKTVDGVDVATLDLFGADRPTGTIHCSALAPDGRLACTTTTSGLSWKIPGRVGDSPILGAGLYCEADVGSAGATGRGEAAILACGSHTAVELMRGGMHPLDAGMEVLRRVTAQARRAASWQAGLVDEEGVPTFDLRFYLLAPDGRTAGVSLRNPGKYAVADPAGGPRHAALEVLHSREE